MPRPITPTYPTQELIAAGFAALRFNDGEVVNAESAVTYRQNPKHREDSNEPPFIRYERSTNAELVRTHFDRPKESKLVITPQDREQASTALDTLEYDRTIKALTGRKLSGFIDTVIEEAKASEHLPSHKAGLLVWIAKLVGDINRNNLNQELVSKHSLTSSFLGKVGDTINLSVEVIDSRWNKRFECWSVTAHTPEGNLVQWFTAYQDRTQSGSYKGMIKDTKVSDYLQGAKVTTLNRVKSVAK